MEFRQATDLLFERVTHDELADALGISVASVRQARLDASAKAHRSAPNKWQAATLRLAKEQIKKYQSLIDILESEAAKSKHAIKSSVKGTAIPVMRDH